MQLLIFFSQMEKMQTYLSLSAEALDMDQSLSMWSSSQIYKNNLL